MKSLGAGWALAAVPVWMWSAEEPVLAATDISLSDIVTATIRKHRGQMVDNIRQHNALLARLQAHD